MKDAQPDQFLNAERFRVFSQGVLAATGVSGMILASGAVGYGALAHNAGLSLELSVFAMIAIFALPAQVVLIDQWSRDVPLITASLVVSLSSLRLLPLAVTLMPLLIDPERDQVLQKNKRRNNQQRLESNLARRIHLSLALHFVAVTTWVEAISRLPHIPKKLRLSHFMGLGCGFITMTILGTILGYLLCFSLPMWLTSALLFLTPMFFALSLIPTGQFRCDWFAICVGASLGPLLYGTVPGIDLLAAGLIGGTLAYTAQKKLHLSPINIDQKKVP